MPQTSAPQTCEPQAPTSPLILLNPWGGLKQYADITCDLDAVVSWQLERHLHWAGPRTPWATFDEIHEALDIRTAQELRDLHLMGRGNMGLCTEHVWYYPDTPVDEKDLPWGKPAEALALHGQRYPLALPKGWMWTVDMRLLLLTLEKWYFNIPYEKRQKLSLDLVSWSLPSDLWRAVDDALYSCLNAAAPNI